MGLSKFLKRSIKRTLEKMGYELRALNRLKAANAVVYNTDVYADRFYSDRKLVDKYKRENVPQHLQNLRSVLAEEKISLQKDMMILDAGCGTGDCLKMLWDEYGCRRLTGTDFSAAALTIARETCPRAHIYAMNLLEKPLKGDFDLILCQQVLEHLEEPEIAMRNLLTVLRPGGLFLITVPDGRLDDFAGHVHFWGQDSLPLFLRKELPGYTVRTGVLQDDVSLYAIVTSAL